MPFQNIFQKISVIKSLSYIFLAPLACIYYAVTEFRNFLYNKKILKTVRFDFPVIGIGNLTVGGTGKTPHTEYLISLLQYILKVATLSRGYGRKTIGFVLADENSTALQIGDEPKQFKTNFPETIVAVAEDRILGVPSVLQAHPGTDVILLDDCFQHRQINPGLSILLTEYGNLFTRDSIMPLGWLREAKENYKRADIIVVTKCPQHLSAEEKNSVVAEIKPYRYQKVYFSYLQYAQLYAFESRNIKTEINKEVAVLLLNGIADSSVLKNFLEQKAEKVYERKFRDHHPYDRYDLESIRETFKNIPDEKKIIITTEKDAARLEEHRQWFSENQIPLFVQPVSVDFLFDEKENFDRDILRYVEFAKDKIAQ